MDGLGSSRLGDRPYRPSERVDEACDRFEADWRAVGAVDPGLPRRGRAADHPALLGELVVLERELRRRDGERLQAAQTLGRFPEHAGAICAAFVGHAPAGRRTGGGRRPQSPLFQARYCI